MKKLYINLSIISILINFNVYASSLNNDELNKLTSKICKTNIKVSSPWHISNLYDCKTKSFFIPYQLWSGAKYDGDKNNSKNHQVNKQTTTSHYGKSGRLSYSDLSISGTIKWISSKYNKEFDIYIRKRSNKIQYFVSNDMGIGRVYDSRGKKRYFSGTNIKFPAGYGWNLNESRTTSYKVIKDGKTRYRDTTIEITDMKFNTKNELDTITFEWYKDENLDHIYTYKANIGLVQTRRP